MWIYFHYGNFHSVTEQTNKGVCMRVTDGTATTVFEIPIVK